ncbi:MAG: hypothetical protein GX540_03460 [Clostridiales bacterium]|nr:hypothetical protein [Clostridiales bacterium]
MEQEERQTGITPEKPPRETLVKRSRDFIQGAVGSLSGKDLPLLVEDFTREMTLVAEGLAEDQARLSEALRLQGEGQDALAEKLRQGEKRLAELERQVADLQKKAERKKESKPGLSQILRQATWLAAILAAAWVITTLVNAFGR